ncbi:MAG TPA: hypothetical protein PLP17_07060, partial [Oligoflexia bacterium]|nr:hypothetical protein [Oligoflexia bacterium]
MHQQSKGFAVSTSLIRGFLTLGALVFSFSGGAYAAAPPTYNSWCTHYDCGPSGAQVEGIKDMMRRRGISINANDAPRANTLTANAVCSLIGYKAGTTNSVGHFPAAPACANYYIVGFNGTNWYKTGSCLDNNYIAALTCSQPVQCQDGIDNDGDGLLDENDPGCSSCLDDSEGPGTSQCQDGLDNDGDGAADYPADASCSSPQDNDETNPKTQCQDGIDNEPDGLIDMEDPGCSSPQDNNEGDEQCVPQAPTGLNAGDGSSADYVGIAWSAAARADTYQVFRISSCAQQNGGQMEAVSPAISGTSFQDASAIPGVVYSYAVKATGYCGTSALSNADNGYRSNGDDGIDNDGDGVSDEQEQADGTDACDAGSFQLHLKSPAFTKYNTFLRQWNFLELIASGTKAIQAKVSVYLLSGVVLATQDVYIEPQKQVDVNIHEMIRTACVQSSYCSGLRDIDNNGIVDTYGLVRIDFNDDEAGAVLTGRMSNYRQDSNGTFSFAFAKELRNPTRGATAATSNTYDPQAMGYLVPNWLEIINLDSVERTFAYNLYNQEGVRVLTKSVSIPPLGERDIQAGHEIVNAQNKVVESVYLAEIIPQNGAAKYFATVSRY